MNKKAISPLASTIMLIVLAVGVGVVVMNWGRAELEAESKCPVDTQLQLLTLNNEYQLCYSGSGDNGIIKATLENGPNTNVHSILITIIGSNKPYNTNPADSAIEKGYAAQIVIPYDFTIFGDVKQIKITPRIQTYSEEPPMLCPEQAISLTTLRQC